MQATDFATFKRESQKTKILLKEKLWQIAKNRLNESDLEEKHSFLRDFAEAMSESAAGFWETALQELERSDRRLLDRWLQAAMPDILSGPQPAYGIIQTRPIISQTYANPNWQFNANFGGKMLAFCPIQPLPLWDLQVKCMAVGRQIRGFNEKNQAAEIIESGYGKSLHSREIWLGLEGVGAKRAEKLSFFIDFGDFEQKTALFSHLHLLHWLEAEQPLKKEIGFPASPLKPEKVLSQLCEAAAAKFGRHFITLHLPDFVEGKTNQTPFAIGDIFNKEIKATRWLRLVFPPEIPVEAIAHFSAQPNCFPVFNLNPKNEDTPAQSHVFDLIAEENIPFFAISEIADENGQRFEEADFFRKKQFENFGETAGTYSKNCRGDSKSPRQFSPQIWLKPTKIGAAKISYWTCDAENANGIPRETALALYNTDEVNLKSTRFMTETSGGRSALNQTERESAFRTNLLSRGRLVTQADIRFFAESRLSQFAEKIEIGQGVVHDANFGLARSIEIRVRFKFGQKPDAAFLQDLEQLIFNASTGLFPIRILES